MNNLDRKITKYVNDHPVRTVIGLFLIYASCEKVVPMIADPISHFVGRIVTAISASCALVVPYWCMWRIAAIA